jgi:hypothetical protein
MRNQMLNSATEISREPMVLVRLTTIEESLKTLEERLHTLADRLSPVLSPAAPEPCEPSVKEPVPIEPAMVTRLKGINKRVDNYTDTLSQLLRCLEI